MIAMLSNRLIHIAVCALTATTMMLAADVWSARAATQLVAQVSISEQKMRVMVDGRQAFEWKVSTAGKGYVTPTGSFKPTRMHEMWYSRKYDNAPMPHSVFFHEGYAVHATPYVKRLGQPASHGCIRLHPDNAADFYELVSVFGPTNTSIVITR